MIRSRTKAWIEEFDAAQGARLAEAVTLTFRNRGDYFGYFNNRSTNMSVWRSFKGKGMVTYPIVGRAIRSKTATASGTKVQTYCEAVRDMPEKKAGAELAKNILKFVHAHNWNHNLETAIAEIAQLQRYCFLLNNYQASGGMLVDVPVTEKTVHKSGATVYTCSGCGFEYTPEDLGAPDFADEFKDVDLAPHDDEERDVDAEYVEPEFLDEAAKTLEHVSSLACPDCGTNSLVLSERARHEKVDRLTGEYEKRDTGQFDTRVISPLLIRFDSYPCAGFEYKRAGWFNYHPLVPLYEVSALAPHLKEEIETGHSRWSESARWHFELSNNTSSSTGYEYKSKNYRLDELIEPNIWWIQPHACAGWESPDDYILPIWKKLESGEWVETNEALFSIKKGETIAQAMERETGEAFRGLLVFMWQEKIVAVGNENFPEKFVGVPWKIDSQSAFPQGEEQLLKLQDAATNVLSMLYAFARRQTLSPLVVDPLGGFDEQNTANISEPGAKIVRKPVSADTTDKNWQHFLGYLQPGELANSIQYFIELIIAIAKEESGVFNETVGNVETTDETLGGRKIALTQSLSLMTPTQRAKAIAMIEFDYQALELWQRHAPDEAFHLIKGTFEEEWKPQDIEAFKGLDIRRELFVTIVEGTDVPRTQVELEQRFMTALAAGLFNEPNPLPLQIRSHVVKSVLGIDFDLGNYTAFKRLAARRYENICQEIEMLAPNEAFTILPDPMTGFPIRQLRPEIVASIAQDVRTAPRQTDDHLVAIEYFKDRLNALAGAKEPNEILIAVCERYIDMSRAFLAASAVQASTIEGMANAAGGQAGAMMGGGMPAGPQPSAPGQETASAVAQ